MENKTILNNELFEVMLKRALIERYTNEINELKREKSPDFSEELENKVNKAARFVGRKDRLKTTRVVLFRLVFTIFAAMGILFGGLLTEPKIYAAVIEVIKSVFATHDSYEYIGQDDVSVFNNKMTLGYIPDGYTLRYVYYSDYDVDMMFDNKDNQQIIFDYGLASGSKISIDNEYTDLQIINRNGTDYYFYQTLEENEFNTIIWYKNGYIFGIDAQFNFDELVKIAENVY